MMEDPSPALCSDGAGWVSQGSAHDGDAEVLVEIGCWDGFGVCVRGEVG
jgi:hypothetical protein